MKSHRCQVFNKKSWGKEPFIEIYHATYRYSVSTLICYLKSFESFEEANGVFTFVQLVNLKSWFSLLSFHLRIQSANMNLMWTMIICVMILTRRKRKGVEDNMKIKNCVIQCLIYFKSWDTVCYTKFVCVKELNFLGEKSCSLGTAQGGKHQTAILFRICHWLH